MLLSKNEDLKETLNTLTSGDIKSIDKSYKRSEKVFEQNDISDGDFSDKVKLTKLIEIADKRSNLTYKEISDLMEISQDEVEF